MMKLPNSLADAHRAQCIRQALADGRLPESSERQAKKSLAVHDDEARK